MTGQTEAGWLVSIIEALAMTYARGGIAHGDDGEEHSLDLHEEGDGHTCPQEAWWSCSCGGWQGGDWMQTGHPVEYPPGEDPMDTMANVRAWLHHVWPSRYTERPSTIMAEVFRSVARAKRGGV